MNDQPSPLPIPPPARAASVVPVEAVFRPRRRSAFSKLLSGLGVLVVLMSIAMNLYLVMAIAAMAAFTGLPAMATSVVTAGEEDQTVAVYELTDIIDAEAAQRFETFYKAVKKDKNVQAVVLRVVSPGGSVASSDEIHHYVSLLKEAGKKVVVSMGAVAASGGYYLSAPADLIVAEDATVTGSIGVVMSYFVLKDTMDSLGIEPIIIKSENADAWKDEGSPFRQPSPREREHLLGLLNHYQQRFEKVVTEGRGDRLKPRPEKVTDVIVENGQSREVTTERTEPFNGKVYAAADAMELGLIDEIGFLSDAIERAAELAELDKPNVLKYHRRTSFMEQILSAKTADPLQRGRELVNELQTPRFEMIWRVD